jgi:hypothetical protein
MWEFAWSRERLSGMNFRKKSALPNGRFSSNYAGKQ